MLSAELHRFEAAQGGFDQEHSPEQARPLPQAGQAQMEGSSQFRRHTRGDYEVLAVGGFRANEESPRCFKCEDTNVGKGIKVASQFTSELLVSLSGFVYLVVAALNLYSRLLASTDCYWYLWLALYIY